MIRLGKREGMQLKQGAKRLGSRPRWIARPLGEYLAFLAFAVRFAPVAKPKCIAGGDHWKL